MRKKKKSKSSRYTHKIDNLKKQKQKKQIHLIIQFFLCQHYCMLVVDSRKRPSNVSFLHYGKSAFEN